LFPIEEKVFPAIERYKEDLALLQSKKNEYNNNVYTNNAERNKLILEISQSNSYIIDEERKLAELRLDYTSQENALCKTCNQSIPLDTNKLLTITEK